MGYGASRGKVLGILLLEGPWTLTVTVYYYFFCNYNIFFKRKI